VRLFKRYVQLCPSSQPAHAFYLQPSKSPTPTCWYSNKPLGHHTLSKTVARLCKKAGISGYKTNHSLRATTATRLYQCGVDEQLVMECTGHRSLEGVHNYKRTSDMQRETLSDILNTKKPRVDGTPTTVSTSTITMSPASYPNKPDPESSLIPVMGTANMQANIKNTIPGAFYFDSCTQVTINIDCNGSK